MKFSTIAASLCVLGTATAFVLPAPATRSGAPTRTRATLEEEMAEKTKAREALIGSKGMEKLLKQLGVDGAEPEGANKAPASSEPPAEK